MMKRFFYILVFVALLISVAYADDVYHEYNLETIKQFKNEVGEKNLVSRDLEGYAGISSPAFIEGSGNTIYDVIQNRIVNLDAQFDIVKAITYPSTSHVYQFGKNYVNFDQDNGFEICSLEGDVLSKIKSIPHRLVYLRGIFLYQNYLFIHDSQGQINSYKFKEGYTGTAELLNTQQTRSLFQDNSIANLHGLTIDGKDGIFLNGQLLTRDFKTFIDFYLEKNKTLKKAGKAKLLTIDPTKLWPDSMKFLGRDALGNWYWGDNSGAGIFNSNGDLIDYFMVKSWEKYTIGIPHIFHNGDFYIIGHNEKFTTLYRLKNIWDRSFDIGVVNDVGVRIRQEPSTTANIVDQLDKGEVLAIIGQSKDSQTISGHSAPWLKVRLSYGLEGWVFGAFVNIQK